MLHLSPGLQATPAPRRSGFPHKPRNRNVGIPPFNVSFCPFPRVGSWVWSRRARPLSLEWRIVDVTINNDIFLDLTPGSERADGERKRALLYGGEGEGEASPSRPQGPRDLPQARRVRPARPHPRGGPPASPRRPGGWAARPALHWGARFRPRPRGGDHGPPAPKRSAARSRPRG